MSAARVLPLVGLGAARRREEMAEPDGREGEHDDRRGRDDRQRVQVDQLAAGEIADEQQLRHEQCGEDDRDPDVPEAGATPDRDRAGARGGERREPDQGVAGEEEGTVAGGGAEAPVPGRHA